MKICVDENIPSVTVQELRLLGHDVLDIRGTADQGMDDGSLWAKVQTEHRLLLLLISASVNQAGLNSFFE